MTALLRADALYDAGRYEQAAALAAQHLATAPDDADALVLLARCRHRLGQEQEALSTVDEALRAEPDGVTAWMVRTDVLLALRAFPEAEQSARRAVELAPQFWGSHYALGAALDRAVDAAAQRPVDWSGTPARKVEAYEAARRAVELGPEEDAAHFLVGITAQRLGDHRTAKRAYETALRLNPESSEAHNNLSLIHMRGRWFRRGAWTKAAEGFVDSAALDRDDREARFNLETMAWGTAAGARWVALIGFFAAALGSAPLRTGGTGADAVVPAVIGAAVLVGAWAGWALWMLRRVPPRVRRPLLLVARGCRPVLAMAAAVGLLGLHSVLTLALWQADAGFVAALGGPLFWTVVITYWVSRAALRRREPGRA
ncbi:MULTISPECIES: tetratricopeptide repeat protein [Streptomyces]|uniref:Tetratricopeptide repeat protein n=1 Tax=Streptomyces solicathayae TaxID=3081768 RepID=A0ABZ0LY52_9ACTN|nr:tetratricopeptide repeat protein [Streptomyces sp. HUAS YS2]WOX24445.1 tetratricopeptide repeat protein [Streptomyces sp. HUAS YS2]